MSARGSVRFGIALAGAVALGAGLFAVPSVRAAAPEGHFAIEGDTVRDVRTGLLWQRAVPAEAYTWGNANTYCQSLSLAGLTGWRLPTVKELRSLVDIRTYRPAADQTVFPNTGRFRYWTSTGALGGYMWAVDFDYGAISKRGPTEPYIRVRCVL